MLEVWPKGSNIIRENLGSSSRDGARILFSNILTFLYSQKSKNQKGPCAYLLNLSTTTNY